MSDEIVTLDEIPELDTLDLGNDNEIATGEDTDGSYTDEPEEVEETLEETEAEAEGVSEEEEAAVDLTADSDDEVNDKRGPYYEDLLIRENASSLVKLLDKHLPECLKNPRDLEKLQAYIIEAVWETVSSCYEMKQ